MKRLLLTTLSLSLLLTACVSTKKYNQTMADYERTDSLLAGAQANNAFLMKKVNYLEQDTARCNSEVQELMNQYNSAVTNSSEREKQLRNQVQALQKELLDYQIQVHDKELKVKELQENLNRKDSIAQAVFQKLEETLVDFSEEDLKMVVKNGRVHVSLSEELLFRSGSSTVNQKGKKALEGLASVLTKNPNLQINIEGHTDSIPIHTSRFLDNWDLSVLRATSVVRLLVDQYHVSPDNIIASGRADNLPIATNETADGREKNRRTEIILTPRLEALYELLDQR